MADEREVVIAGACRTPVGRFLGGLADLSAVELGKLAARAALERAGVAPDAIDEVIFGNVLQAGLGQNPARQVALGSGVPPGVGAFTVNKVCGSGLKAVALAAQAIRAGDAEVLLVGGMESMSNAPYLAPQARQGARLGDAKLIDSVVHDGLWDVYEDVHMGETAERVREAYDVSRQAMDAYAAESHRKAAAAEEAGRFDAERVAVEVPQRKGPPRRVEADEGVRADADAASLSRLRPAFREDGQVTAGNASQLSDGAAAMVVLSARKAAALGVEPQARITGYATAGLEPKWVMMTPVEAVQALEARTGTDRRSYDLIELNEAFAVQACAVIPKLDLDPAKVNVHGGAVALGHPIGASGARILTTLIHALRGHDLRTGLATLCMGGANGLALAVERV